MVRGQERHEDLTLVRMKLKSAKEPFRFSWLVISLLPIAALLAVFFPKLLLVVPVVAVVWLIVRQRKRKDAGEKDGKPPREEP